jgi:hypothetical protein
MIVHGIKVKDNMGMPLDIFSKKTIAALQEEFQMWPNLENIYDNSLTRDLKYYIPNTIIFNRVIPYKITNRPPRQTK